MGKIAEITQELETWEDDSYPKEKAVYLLNQNKELTEELENKEEYMREEYKRHTARQLEKKREIIKLEKANKALVEALENLHNSCMVPEMIHFADKQDWHNYTRYYDEAEDILEALTTYKGENP